MRSGESRKNSFTDESSDDEFKVVKYNRNKKNNTFMTSISSHQHYSDSESISSHESMKQQNNAITVDVTNGTDEEVPKYNPYNPINRKITMEEVVKILTTHDIHVPINNLAIYQLACVHTSYVSRPDFVPKPGNIVYELVECPEGCLPLEITDNERMEFQGDGILQSVMGIYLSERFPDMSEGPLTTFRSKLVNNENLGRMAIEIGLPKWLIISRHIEEVCNGRNNMRILGSMLEAFIGAIYMDNVKNGVGFAYETASRFIINVFETYQDFRKLVTDDSNNKDKILRVYQRLFKHSPNYIKIAQVGPQHNQIYTMGVQLPELDKLVMIGLKPQKIIEFAIGREFLSTRNMTILRDRLTEFGISFDELGIKQTTGVATICSRIFEKYGKNVPISTATNKNKREAEQQCSAMAIDVLTNALNSIGMRDQIDRVVNRQLHMI